MTPNANDLELTSYQREISASINPLNRALRDGKLNQAFIIAMELERAAMLLQRRLNEIQFP